MDADLIGIAVLSGWLGGASVALAVEVGRLFFCIVHGVRRHGLE